MKKTAIAVMLITIASKCVGFIREVVLAYFYGTSGISDAYLIALTIPGVIFAFVGTGIATTYIPLYSNLVREKGVPPALRFTNNLLNLNLVLCTLIVLGGLCFTKPLVQLFASGFSGETLDLAVRFTRITLWGIYFSAAVYLFNGFLQINNNYLIPAAVGFPFNVIVILTIALSYNGNLSVLALGCVLAIAAQLLFIIPFVHQKGFRYQWVWDQNDPYLKKLLVLAVPIILSTSVKEINVLVDRTLASQIVEGGISALNYANKLNSFVYGVFATSIATVIYPVISRMAASKNMQGLKKVLAEALTGINLLLVPATVGTLLFAQPIVRLLFGRGVFDERAISLTAVALFFYALGMVGLGLRLVLSRTFYALQDTKTPMFNATLAVVVNIILNFILARYMGLAGLALATSISILLGTFLLLVSLRKKIGPFGLGKITLSLGKISGASVIMGILAQGAYQFFLKWGRLNLALGGAIVVGVAVYFILIYFLKITEVEEMLVLVKQEMAGRGKSRN